MEADSILFVLCRCRHRLNDGVGAGFRLHAFGFSAPMLFFLPISLLFLLVSFLLLL
jgi:hypothetical protein